MSNKAIEETTHLGKSHTKGFNAGAVEHGACRKLNRVTTHKLWSAQPQGWQSKYPLAAWEWRDVTAVPWKLLAHRERGWLMQPLGLWKRVFLLSV